MTACTLYAAPYPPRAISGPARRGPTVTAVPIDRPDSALAAGRGEVGRRGGMMAGRAGPLVAREPFWTAAGPESSHPAPAPGRAWWASARPATSRPAAVVSS